MYECSDNKAKRSEKQCTRIEKYKHRIKNAFFLCQRRNTEFCASLAVCLWEGREGRDCREVDWAKGSMVKVKPFRNISIHAKCYRAESTGNPSVD